VVPDDFGGGLVGRFADHESTTGHTDEEQRNLEAALKLRQASFEQRKAFHGPGFVVHRRGMAHLASTSGGHYHPSAIADRNDEILDIIAKGDRVWCVWKIRGTHTGELFGIPATGREIELLEMGAWRFANGKVVEAWFFADEFALAAQLGVSRV
jgi:hypothetical protein